MKEKSYRVHLTAEEQQRLEDPVNKGCIRQCARILLLLNEKTDHAGNPVKVPAQIYEQTSQ
jgi:hypothetical protein